MTAPPSTLPRKHLHTIPHGDTLPDGATVEDGYPFLLETGTDPDITRTLYQNQNGDWKVIAGVPAGGTTGQLLAKLSGTDGDVTWEDPPSAAPTSPNGTQWSASVSNAGISYPTPVQGTGTWVLVDNFDQGEGAPVYPPWSRPIGSMSASGAYQDVTDIGEWMVYSPDGSDCLMHKTLGSDLGGAISSVRAHATVQVLPETGKTLEIFVRGAGDPSPGANYYAARVDHAGVLTLVQRLADVETVKETVTGTVVVGDVIHIEANSSDITAYLTHAGVTTASTTYTDTDFGTTPTDVGIRISGGALSRYGCKNVSSPGSDSFL